MRELEYPFDSEFLLRKKKNIKRTLVNSEKNYIDKKVAVLGGSTTNEIISILELFLLNNGIKAEFYESEYNKYWEDIMFDNSKLINFHPDIIYIHTTSRNILQYPDLDSSEKTILSMLKDEYSRFQNMWDKIEQDFHCSIIQNNFEPPYYHLLGNKDCSDLHGKHNYINQLNELFYVYARKHENFYINDINYLSACYGIQNWADPFYWYMYKYALNFSAIPELSYNIATIIKSIMGKNKKAFVLDLDNTLWGGVIGEDGTENIEIGQETAKAEAFTEFQQYLKQHQQLGVLLTINSKNEEKNALAGLAHPDSILKKDDFVSIQANWNPKNQNMWKIAEELNIGMDSMVFIDDNPAERYIISQNIPEVSVPEIKSPEKYIHIIDRSGFFEVTTLSEDDRKRTEMYLANEQRQKQQLNFSNYKEYLLSLEMEAEIDRFSATYFARIAQLTNKSNQFNLTTLRCTQKDIETFASDPHYITLCGRLKDKFGDNGIVAVTSGHIENTDLHIDLWLMSCRVLKREMEYAMMDYLVETCQSRGLLNMIGYYYPTAKNNLVKNFYRDMGFQLVFSEENGKSRWKLNISQYKPLNKVIKIICKGDK